MSGKRDSSELIVFSRRFCDAFISLGYRRFMSATNYHHRDVWLRRANLVAENSFESLVYLQYKPSFMAYGVYFGVLEPTIHEQLKVILTSPRFHPALCEWRPARELAAPCWNLFDAGRGLGLPFLMIPDPDSPTNWTSDFDELVKIFLNEIIHKVVTDDLFSQFLLRSDMPFEWWASDSVLRSGEICLSMIRNGYTTRNIITVLDEFREQIELALGGKFAVDQFVQEIQSCMAI